MNENTFAWNRTAQFSIPQFLLAIFLPSAFAFTGFHFVLPALVANGMPVMVAWPVVAALMLLVLVAIGVFFMHREAKTLGISLWARMCLKRLSLKEWGISLLIVIVGLAASMAAQALVPPFMDALNLRVPDYFPFFLNPTVNTAAADPASLSPGLPLKGSYGLLPLIAVTLLLNIFAEEIYFRAWMLPKLSRYGHGGWVMNGVFFALYHTFQIWLLPTLLVASLIFAFIFYRFKSLWPPFAAHLVGNFLFSILGILMLIV